MNNLSRHYMWSLLGDKAALLPALEKSIAELNKQYSGLSFTDSDKGWIIQIPDQYKGWP